MAYTDGTITTETTPAAVRPNGEARTRRPQGAGKADQLMRWVDSANIAEDLDADTLAKIGDRVKREYEIDENSRSDWMKRCATGFDLAMQIAEEKTFPWVGASNVQYPLVTVGAIQFAARALPAIISGRNVVKGQVRGDDSGVPAALPSAAAPGGGPIPSQVGVAPGLAGGAEGAPQQPGQVGEAPQQQWEVEPGAKRERADRIGRHMSWQLLDEMEEWEEQTDKLLHILPIAGCAFRKTYWDPGLGRNVSELVTADKLVVNYNAKSMETAPRATHEFDRYPYQIVENVRMGLWLDEELGLPPEGGDDDQAPHDFLEQHAWYDLDDDGYPEPYCITVHKETSKVLRIKARYDEDAVLFNSSGEVSKIEPVNYFTKYSFIPNPDGGFYDIGFGWLLSPLNRAINTSINQMLDAGTRQNAGGGFIGSGLKIGSGVVKFRPGEWKKVQAMGGALKENLVPLEHPGPSVVLFQLLGLLIEAAKDISSVKDTMTGDEGSPQEGVGKRLARTEQGMKVFSAIHKRIFRALKDELRKLYRLNRIYLDPKVYFTLLDDPEAIAQEDYEDESLDVAPVADPTMISDMLKLLRAEFRMQFLADPWFKPRELRLSILEAVGDAAEADDLLLEQPPPNPAIEAKADEIDLKKRDQALKEQELGLKQAEAETAEQKALAEVAKLKSEILLNAAKASELGDTAEINEMKVMLDNILERGRIRLEARKIDVEEKKIDAGAKATEGADAQAG